MRRKGRPLGTYRVEQTPKVKRTREIQREYSLRLRRDAEKWRKLKAKMEAFKEARAKREAQQYEEGEV